MAPGEITFKPSENLVKLPEAMDFVVVSLPDGTDVVVCGRGVVYLRTAAGEGKMIDLYQVVPWQDEEAS